MSRRHLLDNIAWHSLTGLHRDHAAGGARARRYVRGFAPIAAFADPDAADGDALAALYEPGETAYIADIRVDAARWRAWDRVGERRFEQLVLPHGAPVAHRAAGVRRLGRADLEQMRRLVARTAPGPFGPRSHELGRYAGIYDAGELVAMAGLRPRTPGIAEIGTVCTAESHRGRGLASQLVGTLADAARADGALPFLHVAEANRAALRVYRRLGFEHRRHVVSHELRRRAAAAR